VRRVGVLFGANAAGDAEGQARIDAFRQAMELPAGLGDARDEPGAGELTFGVSKNPHGIARRDIMKIRHF
jgi:hypothetical protein